MSRLVRFVDTDIELIDGDRGDNYPSKDEFYDKEYCLFLDASNVTNDGFDFTSSHFITKEKDKILRNGKLKRNDIVMMTRGSVGNVALYDETVPYEHIRINSGMIIIRCHNEYSPVFLYYLLKSSFIKKQINDIISGSVQKQFPVSSINALTLIQENQENWALSYLIKKMDDKIWNNNRIYREICELAKTIYDYWFLQYDFPDENGKPYKSSGGKMFWNEEVKREIPVGWAVSPIGKLFTTNRGVSYNSATLEGKGIPMVNLASFTPTGAYKIDGIKNYSGDYTEDKVLKPYDLVMCNTQQTAIDFSKDIIGRALLVPDIFEGNIVSSHHVNAIRTVDETLKFYLYYLFNSDYFHKYVTGYANGTNIMGLVFKGVEKYISEIPEKRVLQEFAKLSLSIEKKKSEIIRENQELISLRNFLLPLLMNGQVGFRQDWLKDYKILVKVENEQ